MKIYLARHGVANAAAVDPDKNLSAGGRQEVEKVAAFLAGHKDIQVARVFHSGKPRAQQTAEILAGAMAPGVDIVKIDGINPNDPVEVLAEQINLWTEDSLVVGHLPYMGKLVSLLVTGDQTINSVLFYAATVVCLEKLEGQWLISWVMGPNSINP